MLGPALQTAKFNALVGDTRLSIPLDHLARLLDRARLWEPQPQPTAHDFSSWVYRLEHSRYHRQSRGQSFLSKARRKVSDVLDRLVDGQVGSWELLSCDSDSPGDKVYECAVLSAAGQPLRLKPDAVFRDSKTGLIAIFEYKVPGFGVSVPANGWPNLAAQLWTYAWADEWADNSNVVLVGATFDCVAQDIELLDVWPRTIKSDPDLNQACSTLFLAWGGQISPHHVSDRSLRKLLSSHVGHGSNNSFKPKPLRGSA